MTQLGIPESPDPADPAAAADTAGEQVLCPLCDYDLRGLAEPRCPECGYAFDWNDLRDPARRKHRYLFEHHPERNVRSFVRTMIGGLLPRRFWTRLLPSQPSRPRRLAIYALVIFISALLPLILFALREISYAWTDAAGVRNQWASYLQTAPGIATAQKRFPGLTAAQILDREAPRPSLASIFRQRRVRMMASYHAIVLAVPVMWVAFTVASLTILQVSLYNARKRQIHLVRCVIYCADIFLWGYLLAAAGMLIFTVKVLTAGQAPRWTVWWNDDETLLGTFAWPVLGLVPVFCYRLIIAFKKYLHFDHPIATILLTQFLVLLAVLLALVFIVT
jgi:hypothetical protein